jgi:hypothetical protein
MGIHAVLLAAYLAAFGGDPSALVGLGAERAGTFPYEAVSVSFRRGGYDGQFYYALAQAPFARTERGIDVPSARHARLLYPALCWLLSGGDPHLLLWVMPLVNLLAIGGLAGLGGWWTQRQGMSPWWGVFLPLALNVGLPALLNLTDVLSSLTVCGLLVAWLTGGPWWIVAGWATAAVFCREQNAAVVLAVLVGAVGKNRGRTCAGLIAALGLWSLWLVLLREAYGVWPFLPSSGNFDVPLRGFLSRWRHLGLGDAPLSGLYHLFALLLLSAQLALLFYLPRLRPNGVLILVALGGAALVLCGGVYLYEDRYSYPRVFAWLPLALWLACAGGRRRWLLAASGASVLIPLAVVCKAWIVPH